MTEAQLQLLVAYIHLTLDERFDTAAAFERGRLGQTPKSLETYMALMKTLDKDMSENFSQFSQTSI
jgi:hypothetical protein